MSKVQKKAKVYRQPYEPATPDTNVRIVVLGGEMAGTYTLAEFVVIVITDKMYHLPT